MGRGNVCTHNECEGLFYLDRDLLDTYFKVTRCKRGRVSGADFCEETKTARELQTAGIQYDYDGSHSEWAYDCCISEMNWDDMVSFVQGALLNRFKSFWKTDSWRRDRHIVLQNELFEIAIVDNEWSVAWCLLERTDIDDGGRNRTLMRRHYQTYLEAIKRILIEGWGEAIAYGSAWVSGRKFTREDLAA